MASKGANALRIHADGSLTLVGTHPSSGRDLAVPVRVGRSEGYVEVPLKGDLFALGAALGAQIPIK